MTTVHRSTPSVLFICVKNGGKSQIAAGFMRHAAGSSIIVASAGTAPGTSINACAAEVMRERGIDIGHERPTPVSTDALNRADRVIVLGTEASNDLPDHDEYDVWDIDEPSTRGIHGRERMELVCEDIERRVRDLARTMLTP